MTVKQTATIGKGKPGPGRPKGSVNKVSADVKTAIMAAFDNVGGSDYLTAQATKNPQAFMVLLGKVLPTQVTADIAGKIVTRIERVIVDPANPDA